MQIDSYLDKKRMKSYTNIITGCQEAEAPTCFNFLFYIEVQTINDSVTISDAQQSNSAEILQTRILDWGAMPGDFHDPGIEPRSLAL